MYFKNSLNFPDFKRVIFSMLKNKVLMFNTGSGICFIFGLIGYWTFSPKYMETQFRQSASSASFIAGKKRSITVSNWSEFYLSIAPNRIYFPTSRNVSSDLLKSYNTEFLLVNIKKLTGQIASPWSEAALPIVDQLFLTFFLSKISSINIFNLTRHH